MLDYDELIVLEDNLRDALNNNLTNILTTLNRTEKLDELLELLNLEHLIFSNSYKPHKNCKIVIIGESEIRENDIRGIMKEFKISKSRLELNLLYEDAVNYNFEKMQFNPSYLLVLVGPMPHSGKSKGEYSSIISKLESEEGYPPIIRLTDKNHNLKISKTSIKQGVQEALEKGFIIAG